MADIAYFDTTILRLILRFQTMGQTHNYILEQGSSCAIEFSMSYSHHKVGYSCIMKLVGSKLRVRCSWKDNS